MGDFKDVVQETAHHFPEHRRKLVRDISRAAHIESKDSRGVWLQDVILCGTPGCASQLVREIQKNLAGYGRSVLFITQHDSHVHVNHDCSYAGKSCRCYWKQKIKEKKIYDFRRRLPRLGGQKRISELTLSDWQRIFLYFSTEGRRTVSPYFSGQVRSIYDEITSLEKYRLERPRRSCDLATSGQESCTVEGHSDDLLGIFTNGESYTESRGSDSRTSVSGTKRRSQENKDLFSTVQRLLFQFPISPIQNIVNHKVYLDSPLKLVRGRSCKLQDVLEIIQMTFVNWTIKDYFTNIYSKPDCVGIFSAGHSSVDQYYYNIEESVHILHELLRFQFNNDEDIIFLFLSDLFNVLDRLLPKCNSILVYSPPSSGKNFFFDAVIDYFLNKGQLGKANKHNNFAFQDAANRRIILWNEPNYESSNTDLLKMILGGDAYNVNVKNKQDIAVYKTPVILLTNNRIPLMSDSAFVDRIKQYTWKRAPYLKDYNKKPYPVAIYHLFLKYKLI